MSPQSAREILLIRSLEASDRDAAVLSLKVRAKATKEAGIEARISSGGGRTDSAAEPGRPQKSGAVKLSATEETRLIERSRICVGDLVAAAAEKGDARRYVAIGLGGEGGGHRGLLIGGILVGAFVLGGASNYLGKEGVVNLLAIPLFGLIAWNLVIYLIMLISALPRKRREKHEQAPSGPIIEAISQWMRGSMEKRSALLDEPFKTAAGDFVAQWFRLAVPAHLGTVRIVAHLGAIFLAAGVLAGMYVRGLGYEYKAGWESTFLDGAAVESWLRILLGPGSTLTGIAIPPGDLSIEQLDLSRGSGEKADRWIHLFAATTAIYIFVPRAFFVAWEFLGLSLWRRNLGASPLFVAYYEKLVTSASGAGQLVRVLPYHCSPEPRQRDSVRGLVHQLWGGAVHVDFSDPAGYGEEDEMIDSLKAEQLPGYLVLLMSLSATPEGEAHGYLVGEVQKQLRASEEKARLVVLLDENRFRERFGKLPEFKRRLEERRTAWNELVKPLGIEIGYFNSDDIETAEQLARDGERLVWSTTGSAG